MQLIRLASVDSTNEHARRLVRRVPRGPDVCVVAGEQTAGRGTRGRRWVSPRGVGLYLSVVQRHPPVADRPTDACTRAVAPVIASALAALTSLPVGIKPINDLVLGEDKLGGILVEALFSSGQLSALITGVGINVHAAPTLPADAPLRATALAEHTSASVAGAVLAPQWISRLAVDIAAANRQVLAPASPAIAGS